MKNNRFVAIVLVPGFLFLLVFVVFPVAYGLGISFYDYNPANSQNPFTGIENYKRLIHDEVFWIAVKNTIFFCVAAVTANIVITLFLAEMICILPSKWMKTLFRTILFIPCIAPMVGTSTVWKYGIFGTDGGALNRIAGLFGAAPKNWFLTTWQFMLLIIVFTLWADIGYNVVLFTAGIEGVPKEFEEAGAIDGAGPVRRFLWIKLPLMGRTFAFVAIMTMANYFQMFAQFRVFAASGGRNDSAMVLTNYVYKMSFDSFDMGYASAVAAALFVLVFAVAMLQNKMMRMDWSYE
ncbi:MAG: sugar ABC transporter permease [Dorea sp.]|uniref:carbohydrate ABC transporter permease n=1 Tax=Sporofaciens musculi TaxID=2681861 RepID=UPI00216D381C|nr:sugar ABC transporter permease [Sporofaciens musculi]MCI9421781.1 sugar ABC transporter permease [Dorea sp.]